jgi:bile acid-coenzyme A ligase
VNMVSVQKALSYWVDSDPNKPALTDTISTLTRLQLDKRTNRLAREFQSRGVVEGSFVTIILPNCIEYIESAIAALKLGATPQPVSARLPKRELDAIIDLVKPSLIVGITNEQYERVSTLPLGFVASDKLSSLALPDKISKHWKAPTSGGSTGKPKLIVSGSSALVDMDADSFSPPLLLPVDGSILIPGPLYHNGPFTLSLQGLFKGNHVVIMERFDALETLHLLEVHKIQTVLLVPTMMSRISKLPVEERTKYNLETLKVAYHMASNCPDWLKESWINWLGADRVYELYGGTEMQALTIIRGSEWLQHRGSVGRCLVGEMKILNEDGTEVPNGEVGDIYMRSAPGSDSTYFYIGAEPDSRDGWDTIGDIGWFDEEGYLYLADRRKDLIIRGGANIFPAEVEAAIEEHPAVRSSAVIGLPDDEMGELVHAIVHCEYDVAKNELLQFVSERIAKYKVPSTIEFSSKTLRDDAGKIRRSALKEERLR